MKLSPVEKAKPTDQVDYIIESTYQVPGVGVVVGGYLTTGMLKEGQMSLFRL